MQKNNILQKDYTLSSLYYQIKLPLDIEKIIPADDPVRLLSAFVEGIELSDLYKTYGKIKKRTGITKTAAENCYIRRYEPDLFQSRYRNLL